MDIHRSRDVHTAQINLFIFYIISLAQLNTGITLTIHPPIGILNKIFSWSDGNYVFTFR